MGLSTTQEARINRMCPANRVVPIGTALVAGLAHNIRVRATAAQVNAGLTILTPPSGKKVRVTDITMIAIGGAAATATTIDILDGATKLLAVAVAALTQSAVVRAGATNATVLADGASFTARAADAAISIGKTGSNMTGATDIDVILSYVLE